MNIPQRMASHANPMRAASSLGEAMELVDRKKDGRKNDRWPARLVLGPHGLRKRPMSGGRGEDVGTRREF